MRDTCKWCTWSAITENPKDILDDQILTCYIDIGEHVRAGDSACCDFVYDDQYPRL